MINASFKKKDFAGVFCLACGLLLTGLFIFLGFADGESTIGNILAGVGLGSAFVIFGIIFLLFNFKAFLFIKDERIKGRYHWFGRIDSPISDIIFAVSEGNTLLIQLKGGKMLAIMGIENSWEIASALLNNIPFKPIEDLEALQENLTHLKAAKKKDSVFGWLGVAIAGIVALVATFLVEIDEAHPLSQHDEITYPILGVMCLIGIVVTFCFAFRISKKNLLLKRLEYLFRRQIIETKPLLFGDAIKVYTDPNYLMRITFFSNNDDQSVYYITQVFASDLTFFKSYESETFENIEQLNEDLNYFVDLTDKFLR